MKISKSKTITELRNSLFETFDEVVEGGPQMITHKNLAIGYAQAMRGEGVSSQELKKKLKDKEKKLREKYG